ncbi:MAG: dihydroorotate dehydrogenase [Rhodobacteraceae bacterium]|nr:dihydroorotate dehydrogenase [Paracoccaceae bacterium]
MTTERPDHSADDLLESCFADARAHPPQLGPDLRARILADAAAIQAQARSGAASPQRRSLRQILAEWLTPALAGGAVAAAAGFWVGVWLPMPVVALDLPLWLDTPLAYLDLISLQIMGLDDPLWMEF